jgi:anti-anti-sigma regulatory factor
MSIRIERTGGQLHVDLADRVTKFEVTELHDSLLAAFETKPTPAGVHVDLSGVKECDTAGLQLLLSARKSADEAGISCSFAPYPWPRFFEKTLARNAIDPEEYHKPVQA